MIKICFICLGNICRSPMAEFIAKHKINQKNLDIDVDSAGTSGYHDGEFMHQGTKKILDSHHIDVDKFTSKKLSKNLFDSSNYVIVMDNQNYHDVLEMFSYNHDKVLKLMDFSSYDYNGVPDPWYTKNFDEVYMILDQAIDNLLLKITK